MAKYDVFLSQSEEDEELEWVEIIAQRLRQEAQLKPFFESWHLVPGRPKQEALEEALHDSETMAVFVGRSGISYWHNEKMRIAVDKAVRTYDEYRVIPVLLPGADPDSIPDSLARRIWVDFRSALDDAEAFERLVAGIKGEAIQSGDYDLPDSCDLGRNDVHHRRSEHGISTARYITSHRVDWNMSMA